MWVHTVTSSLISGFWLMSVCVPTAVETWEYHSLSHLHTRHVSANWAGGPPVLVVIVKVSIMIIG